MTICLSFFFCRRKATITIKARTPKIENISTVVIDEKLGRRIARLHDLKVTGSIGILVKAIRLKILPSLDVCFDRMEQKGIWISQNLKDQALKAIRL